jgi:hypothetical protein
MHVHRPDPDRHALDADPDPEKLPYVDPTRCRSTKQDIFSCCFL